MTAGTDAEGREAPELALVERGRGRVDGERVAELVEKRCPGVADFLRFAGGRTERRGRRGSRVARHGVKGSQCAHERGDVRGVGGVAHQKASEQEQRRSRRCDLGRAGG